MIGRSLQLPVRGTDAASLRWSTPHSFVVLPFALAASWSRGSWQQCVIVFVADRLFSACLALLCGWSRESFCRMLAVKARNPLSYRKSNAAIGNGHLHSFGTVNAFSPFYSLRLSA